MKNKFAMPEREVYLDVENDYPEGLIGRTALVALGLREDYTRSELMDRVATDYAEGSRPTNFDRRMVLDAIDLLEDSGYIVRIDGSRLRSDINELKRDFPSSIQP